MKKICIVLTASFLTYGCVSYTSFIPVTPRTDIPDGSREIIVYAPLEVVLEGFRSEGILLQRMDGGAQTEEILIDEATRAKYTIHEFENLVKIIPYWGVTDKVRQEMAIWLGYAASQHHNDMERVVYNNQSGRPKMVFDYGIQIAFKVGRVDVR